MIPFRGYIAGAVLVALLGLVAHDRYLAMEVKSAREELVFKEQLLLSCNARITKLREKAERDETIDDLSDDELRNIPDRWLRR